MKILDWYILKKFLGTYFFMLLIIMVLGMVFDISERMSEFLENNATWEDILGMYYVNFFIHYGMMFSSLIVFISVIWFTAKLAQTSEIIPILNSGRPFTRFLRPYVIGATLLTVVTLLMNHFVLPNSNKQRLLFEEKYYRVAHHVESYHGEFPGEQFVFFESYSGEDSTILKFSLEKWYKGKPIYYMKAQQAKNNPLTKRWVFKDYFERRIGDLNDEIKEGLLKDTILNFSSADMIERETGASTKDFGNLTDFITREKAKGSSLVAGAEIELYARTAYPFAIFIFTILGVSVSSRKTRGGIGMNLTIGFVFVFIYLLSTQVMTASAIKIGFPAILAVWVPNVMFGIIAFFMYRFAPK
jgi:lipopolysaccharide export system permease protein